MLTLISAMLENSNFLGNLNLSSIRVKSGSFGCQVISDIHLQTVEIQMRRLLMSSLITICLVYLMFYSKILKNEWSLSQFT